MTPFIGNADTELSELADIIAGTLAGAKMHLFKSNTLFSRNTVLGDLTACNYTGYVAQSLVYSAASLDASGKWEVVSHALTFRPSDAVTPNTAFGYYVTDTAGAVLIGGGTFNDPVSLQNAFEQVILILRVQTNPAGSLDLSI